MLDIGGTIHQIMFMCVQINVIKNWNNTLRIKLGCYIDQFIRNKIKYEQDRDGVLQLVRNELNFQMEEKGLQFPP